MATSSGISRDPAFARRAAEFQGDLLELDPGQLIFDSEEVKTSPDRCGYRVVRLVYEKFGFDSEAIPREFDRTHGVLTFPDSR